MHEVEKFDFKSKHEEYFYWWLLELIDREIISEANYEPHSYLLSEKLVMFSDKKKPKILLQEHKYTPDFTFKIVEKYSQILEKMGFIKNSEDNSVIIEIKPKFNMNNMNRLFSVNQKWVWSKYGIFVQKIVVDDLFEETFVPKRYIKTDKNLKNRVIKYDYKLIDDYLNHINKEIN
jgi:hypothetical protein